MPRSLDAFLYDTDVVRVDEVGHSPAVQVVLTHALLDKPLTGICHAIRHRREQHFHTNVLVVAGIIAIVQLMTSTELAADGIPQELHELYSILCVVAIGAAQIFVQVRAQLRDLEVRSVGVDIDQAARHNFFDELLDARVNGGGERPIGEAIVHIGQYRAIGARIRVHGHGGGEAPERMAPRQHLAHRRLHAAELVGSGGLDRFHEQTRDEVELHRQPRGAVEGEAVQEARNREEVRDLLEVAVDQDVLPGDQYVVQHQYGIVFVEPAGERVVKGATHHRGGHLVGRPTEQLQPWRIHG